MGAEPRTWKLDPVYEIATLLWFSNSEPGDGMPTPWNWAEARKLVDSIRAVYKAELAEKVRALQGWDLNPNREHSWVRSADGHVRKSEVLALIEEPS
jgi:hypothetical protein